MEFRVISCLLAIVMLTLVPSCSLQNPDDVHLLLKAVIDFQQEIMLKLEEQSAAINSLQQCCHDSREQTAAFQNIFTTDECKDNSHNCSEFATCKDHLIYYDCICLQGYSGDGFTCHDIDECSDNVYQCGERQTCTNSEGSYHCMCEEGFQMDNNNVCQDIDECELGTYTCDPKASCKNTIGNYSCISCEWPFSLLTGVGCILLVNEDLTWVAAKSNCEDVHGGILYEPETSEEFMNLANHFTEKVDHNYIWVGVKSGKWVSSGKEVSGELWREGDPDEGIAGYGYMRKASSYKLGDYRSIVTWPSLCKLV